MAGCGIVEGVSVSVGWRVGGVGRAEGASVNGWSLGTLNAAEGGRSRWGWGVILGCVVRGQPF
jgi:hypothetical protein